LFSDTIGTVGLIPLSHLCGSSHGS